MIPQKESDSSDSSSTGSSSDPSPLETLLQKAFSSIFNELIDKMGLGSLFAVKATEGTTMSDFLTTLMSSMLTDAANTLLSGTGLEKLLSTKLDEELAACIEKLPANLKAGVTTEVQTTLKNAILSQLADKLKNFDKTFFNKNADKNTPKDESGNAGTTSDTDAANTVATSYDATLQTMASNIVNDLFGNLIDVNSLMSFFQQGAADKLLANAQTALANMGKALTTAALDAITYWCGTKLEPEKKVPTNDITTTAIAGAGASNVGVAGSAAIAVVNGTSKAYISSVDDSSKYPIKVTGNLAIYSKTVQAEETTSTSSVTADGSPDKNLAAGASDTADNGEGTGGGSTDEQTGEDSTDSVIKIDKLSHGKITFEKNGKTVELTVTPNKGYTIQPNTVTATIKNSDGTTVKTIPVVVLLGTYNFNIPTLAAGQTILVTAQFDGKASYTITADPAVTVTTEGGGTTAAEGERITAAVKVPTGKKVATITYTKAEGAGTKQIALTLDNANTNTYVFFMPANNVTIAVTFADSTGAQQAVSSSGASVGVGAAFSFTYSKITAEAGIGANRSVTAGTADITAEADHNAETVTAAGTDPVKTDTSTTTTTPPSTTGISIDGSRL